MTEILAVLLSFPAAVYTVASGVAMVYWLFVILGALDIDAFDSAAGAGKGSVEGALKGGAEGVAGMLKGGADGVAGALKGGADGVAGALKGGADGVAGVLKGASADLGDGGMGGDDSALFDLAAVPITVAFSLFALFGLLLTGLYGLTFGLPGALVGTGVLVGSTVVSFILTAFAVKPLAPLFKVHKAKKSSDLVGKIAVVSTGRVTERFGQANYEDGGAGLILEVRDPRPNDLKKGDRVVLIHWDQESESFEVEKLPDSFGPRARIGDALAADEVALDEAAAASPEGRRAHGP